MRTLTKNRLRDINDDLWSLIVRTRDNFVCKMCGTQTKHSEAHHIFGKVIKITRWNIDNGITLCFYCHRFKMHGGNLSNENRIELFRKILGREKYEKLKLKAESLLIVKFNLEFCKEEFKRLMYLTVDMNIATNSDTVPRYIVKELFPEWFPTKEMLKDYEEVKE